MVLAVVDRKCFPERHGELASGRVDSHVLETDHDEGFEQRGVGHIPAADVQQPSDLEITFEKNYLFIVYVPILPSASLFIETEALSIIINNVVSKCLG